MANPISDGDDVIATAYRPAPGTTLLYDKQGDAGVTSKRLHTLQHVQHGDANILLVPQPSATDRNDPLLWPSWLKWTVLANGCFYSFMGSVAVCRIYFWSGRLDPRQAVSNRGRPISCFW